MFNFLVSVIISFNIIFLFFGKNILESIKPDNIKIDTNKDKLTNNESKSIIKWLDNLILFCIVVLGEYILELVLLVKAFYIYELSTVILLTVLGYILPSKFENGIIRFLLSLSRIILWIILLFSL